MYNESSHPKLKINILRGSNIESQHEVSALVVDSKNQTQISWGSTDLKIYPRSSIKPIQALIVILSGAFEKFKISNQELALACGSHSGEKEHVQAVSDWLARLNLSELNLECGAHLPSNQNASSHLLNQNKLPSALHNNCSGKHTGMLASALALGVDTTGYVQTNHPIQKLIREIIEDFCSEKITESDIAIDGCSIPTYFLNLKNLAFAMARVADPNNLPEKYRTPIQKIYNACVENPFYIAGTERYCTRMITALHKRALIKTGAEGVMFASIPEQKIGIVVKAHDGATRAAEMSMSWILKELGILDQSTWESFSEVPIKNWNQILTGKVTLGKISN